VSADDAAGPYQSTYHLPPFEYDNYEKLAIERRGPVFVCTFNDPKNLNAMSYLQMSEFNDFLQRVRLDDRCRVIVLTGAGRSFCAGFNLKDLALEPPDDMGRVQRDFYVMQRMCSDQVVNMRRCEQPIIGALKGYAIGGGLSLACACDLRVLGESFTMNAGYLTIGLTGTDMGGAFFLPKIVGYARAAEILMTGRRFGAGQLADWGFASRVVPDDEVLDAAIGLAQEIAGATSPFGLRLTKECLQASLDGTNFESVVKIENRNQVLAASTQDGRDGVVAMRDRQPITFHNK
jgi:enoyl-CoA hydratase/carnithine racemase